MFQTLERTFHTMEHKYLIVLCTISAKSYYYFLFHILIYFIHAVSKPGMDIKKEAQLNQRSD